MENKQLDVTIGNTLSVSATNKSVFLKKSFAHFIHEYFNLIALDPTPSLLPPFRRPWVAQVTAGVSSKPGLEKKRSSNRLSLLLINKQMLFKSGVKKYIRPDIWMDSWNSIYECPVLTLKPLPNKTSNHLLYSYLSMFLSFLKNSSSLNYSDSFLPIQIK